jgi:hypothetical protein
MKRILLLLFTFFCFIGYSQTITDGFDYIIVTTSSYTTNIPKSNIIDINRYGNYIYIIMSDNKEEKINYTTVTDPVYSTVEELLNFIKAIKYTSDAAIMEQDDTPVDTIYTYVGYAQIGDTLTSTATWAIQKITEYEAAPSLMIMEWADGNKNFDNIWDNRASLYYVRLKQ